MYNKSISTTMLHWPTVFHFRRRLAHNCTSIPVTTSTTGTAAPSAACSCSPARLTSVPCEILYLVFSKLSFKDYMRCMRVCRSWRAIILDWSDAWSTLSTRQGCDIGSDLSPYGPYIRANAVHKVYFDHADLGPDNGSTTPMTRMIDFLTEQGCSNIHEAELNGYFDASTTFIRFANLTSQSLVHLAIKSHDNEMSTMQVLNTVLRWCPQVQTLVCITVAGWPSILIEDLLAELVPHNSLTDLTIQMRRQVQLPLQMIVKYLPKLRALTVPPGNCENVDLLLDVLDRSCNDIESIRITAADSPSLLLPLNQPPGYLRELAIADYRLPVSAVPNGTNGDPAPTDHLHRLLQTHSATLEILSLGDATALNQATMILLASLDFPSLQAYGRSTGVHNPTPPEYDPGLLCGFLLRCPRLETIHLVDRGTNDQVLACLECLPSIRSLQLHYSDRVSTPALTRLLQSRPLEHLSLHSVQAMSDSVLCVLNTSRLKTLRVTLCKQISIGAGLGPFLATAIRDKLDDLEVTCILASTDTGAVLESVLGAMSKLATRWKLKLHRQNDYYPHPELSLITDTHWNRRRSYFREILARMDR